MSHNHKINPLNKFLVLLIFKDLTPRNKIEEGRDEGYMWANKQSLTCRLRHSLLSPPLESKLKQKRKFSPVHSSNTLFVILNNAKAGNKSINIIKGEFFSLLSS